MCISIFGQDHVNMILGGYRVSSRMISDRSWTPSNMIFEQDGSNLRPDLESLPLGWQIVGHVVSTERGSAWKCQISKGFPGFLQTMNNWFRNHPCMWNTFHISTWFAKDWKLQYSFYSLTIYIPKKQIAGKLCCKFSKL